MEPMGLTTEGHRRREAVGEDESSDTEKEESAEGVEQKPVCSLGSECSHKGKDHFSKYAHPIRTTHDQVSQGKRKREDAQRQEGVTEGAEEGQAPAKKARLPNGQAEGLSDGVVEPTLLVDQEPTLLVEEVESTQVMEEEIELKEQEAKPRPKLVRQYSSQMHLDVFLDKVKQQREEEGEGTRAKEACLDEDAEADGVTQMIEDEGKRGASGADEMKSSEGGAEDRPPLEAPSSDLPDDYVDAWDDEHIRLPCSPQNAYRRLGARSRRLLSRWYLIHTVLAVPIRSSLDLQEAIIAYNCTEDSQYAQYWDFSGLHHFFQQMASKEEFQAFFDKTLPFIIRLALRLPELFKEPTALLAMGEDRTLKLTQEQIASLLANGFLCTFPKQGPKAKKGRKTQYPSFSFHTLFMGAGDRCLPNQAAKLRCVFHYFERLSEKMPTGSVTFERKALEDEVPWGECEDLLSGMTVFENGTIEDVEEECLEIDFANKMVGGGVLGYGCIQEEIRFLINTELIVSLLFTARLQDNECLIVTGTERFCKYTGYAKTFRFAGDYEDTTPRDKFGRRRTQVVAMDALYFGSSPLGRLEQYRIQNIERELNKCYVAFSAPPIPPLAVTPIATGNWGCGAFGGFHDVKAIVQFMAAAVARRPIRYYTFGEAGLGTALKEVHTFLEQKQVTVAGLWQALCEVSLEITDYLERSSQGEAEESSPMPEPQLFNILFDRFDVSAETAGPLDKKGRKKDKGKDKVLDDEGSKKPKDGEMDDEATIEL